MPLSQTRNEAWPSAMDTFGQMETLQLQSAVTELERKIIRLKSACISSFSRPIDSENLTDAQYELSALKLQLSST